MTHFLHYNGAPYRYFAVLVLMVLGLSSAKALESDDINTAILVEGSLPPTWTNDAVHPWYIYEPTNGKPFIESADFTGSERITSTISFSYTSPYPTEITFGLNIYRYNSSDSFALLIDGEEKSGIETSGTLRQYRFIIPAGSHTVEFVLGYNNTNGSLKNYS